ncbi:MAG: DUF5340 domain-containing protein [Cyanobacteria bacterium J06639_1]
MHIPLPSHAHYEFLLEMLEQQTLPAVDAEDAANRARTQELIITLRKALSQQRQLESDWRQRGVEMDYRWTLDRDIPNP